VLIKAGDASAEIDQLVRSIGSAEAAGLHRVFFVELARQTVVMTISPESPLALALRGRRGWSEPRDS
jgi:hypothetical protein